MNHPIPPPLDRAVRAEALAAELAAAALQSHAPGAQGRLRLLAAVERWNAHVADLDTLDSRPPA